MTWYRSCPRCRAGDVRENRDRYGHYVLCVQCGYYLTDLEIAWLRHGLGLRNTAALDGQTIPAASVLARR